MTDNDIFRRPPPPPIKKPLTTNNYYQVNRCTLNCLFYYHLIRYTRTHIGSAGRNLWSVRCHVYSCKILWALLSTAMTTVIYVFISRIHFYSSTIVGD